MSLKWKGSSENPPRTDLHIKDRVEVCGLSARADLNGTTGLLLDFDEASQRWKVRFDTTGQNKMLKADNLRLLEAGLPGHLLDELLGPASAATTAATTPANNGQAGRRGGGDRGGNNSSNNNTNNSNSSPHARGVNENNPAGNAATATAAFPEGAGGVRGFRGTDLHSRPAEGMPHVGADSLGRGGTESSASSSSARAHRAERAERAAGAAGGLQGLQAGLQRGLGSDAGSNAGDPNLGVFGVPDSRIPQPSQPSQPSQFSQPSVGGFRPNDRNLSVEQRLEVLEQRLALAFHSLRDQQSLIDTLVTSGAQRSSGPPDEELAHRVGDLEASARRMEAVASQAKAQSAAALSRIALFEGKLRGDLTFQEELREKFEVLQTTLEQAKVLSRQQIDAAQHRVFFEAIKRESNWRPSATLKDLSSEAVMERVALFAGMADMAQLQLAFGRSGLRSSTRRSRVRTTLLWACARVEEDPSQPANVAMLDSAIKQALSAELELPLIEKSWSVLRRGRAFAALASAGTTEQLASAMQALLEANFTHEEVERLASEARERIEDQDRAAKARHRLRIAAAWSSSGAPEKLAKALEEAEAAGVEAVELDRAKTVLAGLSRASSSSAAPPTSASAPRQAPTAAATSSSKGLSSTTTTTTSTSAMPSSSFSSASASGAQSGGGGGNTSNISINSRYPISSSLQNPNNISNSNSNTNTNNKSSAVDEPKLIDILERARPNWSAKDLESALAKLAIVGVVSTQDLRSMLEGSRKLNACLRAAGQKAFNEETINALSNVLKTTTGKS